MAQRVFTKDTMLDLVVNIIPLGIMAFFMGLFVIWGPFSWDPLYSTLMLGIIGGSFVLLTILTYVSAIAIEGDAMESEETEREAREQAVAEAAAEAADGDATADAADGDLTAQAAEETPDATGDDDADDSAAAADGEEEYEEVF